MTFDLLKEDISGYYSRKVREHGTTHSGVDWNSTESQKLRFYQLLRGFDLTGPFSLNDYGCGYGALFSYLREDLALADFNYAGYDLSEDMIAEARQIYAARPDASFWVGDKLAVSDYTVASGIFNVRLNQSNEDWQAYVLTCIEQMNATSRRGFSFNILTSYSDADKQRPDLYYADPCFYFDYAKRHYSKNVALFHDYGLYEFTISVRKA